MKNIDITNININFDSDYNYGEYGEFGIHDGFFNAWVVIGHIAYDFQCCTNDSGGIDFDDCGYNSGVCGDVNEELSGIIEWDNVLLLLKKAYKQYKNK